MASSREGVTLDHELCVGRLTASSYLSRALYGELPGGSGNGPLILAHLGRQVTIQLPARQPGQLSKIPCSLRGSELII